MKKFNVVAASAVALSAALASGSALAHGTLAITAANYNAASVAAASGIVTVPWNGGGSLPAAVYTVTTTTGGATTSLEVNSRFTVTLPSGFTFASAPSVLVAGGVGGTATATLGGGGIGSQSATFVIGTAPIGVGGTVTLQQASVQGATALETPGAKLQLTVQSTNNAQINNNDASAVTDSVHFAFTSDTGVTATFGTSNFSNRNYVDLTSPSLGVKFLSNGTDTTTIDLGEVTLTGSGSLAANGSVATISTSDTVSLSLNGFFNGITSVFSTVGGAGCAATATSTGTVASGSITLPAATGLSSDICITANATTLLSANTPTGGGFTATYAPGSSVTDFLGSTVQNTADSISYTGGTPINVTNFLTGTDAGYQSLVRVSNGSTSTNTLFAVAQPYSGGAALVGSLGTIGAGIGTVFTEAQIGTATSLSLANSGQRATLTIIAIPGGSSVTASGLLVNPGGVVDNVN